MAAIGLKILGRMADKLDIVRARDEIIDSFKKQVEDDFDQMMVEIESGQSDPKVAESWQKSISKDRERGEFKAINTNPLAINAEFGSGAHTAPNGVVRSALHNHHFDDAGFGRELRKAVKKRRK